MTKSLHKYINPNPLKKETGDCVFRACVLATGKEWDTVYRELCEIGFELKEPPNMRASYEKFFLDNGFEYVGVSVKKGSKRPTVAQMAKETKGTNKIIVCRVANHIVTAKDGFYWDLWDSGKKSLYGYWVREEK